MFLLLLAGCGGGLQSSWNNFTAYYNTFYNAKHDFKTGLNKIEEQPVQIDPDMPVRPHPVPVQAGADDFEEAINKSAQILRRHSESKWADDALLLIGKSYYYRQEFFLAIQTFEDLLNYGSSQNLHQQATLWKGRALLDISSYSEGVTFLESQLSAYAGEWDSERKAEAHILLAQHHAMLEHWQQAAELLEPAILKIEDRPLKARSYFLLGQVFQQRNDFNRAFQAYSNVASNFPDYEYIYWAGIKRAEAARFNGNTDLALSIYRSMLNDDKNFERSDKLNFQLGQTYEQQGDIKQAGLIYRQILRNEQNTNTVNISSDVYYQLGQLYSTNYNNYELAAAYFDSASLQASKLQQKQESDDATTLASAFGNYVSLKSQIARIDSLLALGNLGRQALDSALVEIRRQKRISKRNNKEQVAQQANAIANVNQGEPSNDTTQGARTSSFGFLNYRNARSVENSKQQFRAVWGARPLVDNWRRTNAVLSTSGDNGAAVPEGRQGIVKLQNNDSDERLGINIEEVPVTAPARVEKRQERLSLQYQLGNLFFLTLNQPDSAKIYFKQVLQDSLSSGVTPRSLYSLVQLYDLQQKPDSAAQYRRRIMAEYPESVFARQVQNQQDGGDEAGSLIEDNTALLREQTQKLLGQESSSPSRQRAEQLRALALDNRNSELAPAIFYQGIREYIRFAKTNAADSAAIPNEQAGRTDSLRSDSLKNSSPAYAGKNWDRVREWLEEFRTIFPNAPQIRKIDAWKEVLSTSASGTVLSCRDLGAKPVVKPDMPSFINAIELPARVKKLNLSGSLRYRLLINDKGRVDSYELLSTPTGLGIEGAYEQAIENDLQFAPIIQKGRPVRASCEVEFPIKQ